jgi:hypothetical protein
VFATLHAQKAERWSLALAAGFIAKESLVAVGGRSSDDRNLLQSG